MAEVTDDQLRLLVERIERLEAEKAELAADIRDVYAGGKARGYDARIIRQIVRLRKMRHDDRAEMEALLDTYKCALGMAGGDRAAPEPLPLEEAIARATDAELAARGLTRIDGPDRDGEEDIYDRAVCLVTDHRKASTSWLQRQLGLGYNFSAGLIERMEKAGIVSAPDGSGRREVLAPAQLAEAGECV